MEHMVNMAKTQEELRDSAGGSLYPAMPERSIYPYGLCICLTHDELEKLDLDADCEVGDMIHLMAMAKVTSISKNQTSDGESCRIELQITDLAVEDEDEEAEETPEEEAAEERPKYKLNPNKFYKG